jgi:sugar/nucleoside kinase (ribokinase family)
LTPDFIVIGHVVKDILSQGWRLGGTASFAAVQAKRLGVKAGVVTRVGEDLDLAAELPGIAIAGRPSAETTCFENIYDAGRRRQRVPSQAPMVEAEDVPAEWREAPIVLLGPVCGEAPAGLAATFPRSLVGVSAQGWLRQVDRERRVRRFAWRGAPFWTRASVLFVSDEDLGERRDQLERWIRKVPIVALTRYRRGAQVYSAGGWRQIRAFPTVERDPTGAGDVFATAFLVRYHETKQVAESARFASAAAACSVEGAGVDAVADRAAIVARMEEHPEILLQ